MILICSRMIGYYIFEGLDIGILNTNCSIHILNFLVSKLEIDKFEDKTGL